MRVRIRICRQGRARLLHHLFPAPDTLHNIHRLSLRSLITIDIYDYSVFYTFTQALMQFSLFLGITLLRTGSRAGSSSAAASTRAPRISRACYGVLLALAVARAGADCRGACGAPAHLPLPAAGVVLLDFGWGIFEAIID